MYIEFLECLAEISFKFLNISLDVWLLVLEHLLDIMDGFRNCYVEYISITLRNIVELCIRFRIDFVELFYLFHLTLLEKYLLLLNYALEKLGVVL